MLASPAFWRLNQAGAILLYLAGLALLATGHGAHPVVLLCAVILVVHLLEMPMAFKAVRRASPPVHQVLVGTFLFGFLYWLPIQRGVFRGPGAAAS